MFRPCFTLPHISSVPSTPGVQLYRPARGVLLVALDVAVGASSTLRLNYAVSAQRSAHACCGVAGVSLMTWSMRLARTVVHHPLRLLARRHAVAIGATLPVCLPYLPCYAPRLGEETRDTPPLSVGRTTMIGRCPSYPVGYALEGSLELVWPGVGASQFRRGKKNKKKRSVELGLGKKSMGKWDSKLRLQADRLYS